MFIWLDAVGTCRATRRGKYFAFLGAGPRARPSPSGLAPAEARGPEPGRAKQGKAEPGHPQGCASPGRAGSGWVKPGRAGGGGATRSPGAPGVDISPHAETLGFGVDGQGRTAGSGCLQADYKRT